MDGDKEEYNIRKKINQLKYKLVNKDGIIINTFRTKMLADRTKSQIKFETGEELEVKPIENSDIINGETDSVPN